MKSAVELWIDTEIIKENKKILDNLLTDKRKIIAVIKANGYGCDLIQSAILCKEMGIDILAVLSIEQAVQLREAGIQGPILLLGTTLEANFIYLIQYDITQAAISYEYAQTINRFALEHDQKIKVHIKVDTGLNRLGYKCMNEIIDTFSFKGLQVEGVYSHFVNSQSYDQNDLDFSYTQIEKFKNVIRMIKDYGYDPKITHLQNSPSVINFGDLGFEAVRVGMILFGLFHPSQRLVANNLGLRSCLELHAKISMVKKIKKGEYVGYGREFQATEDMEIATVETGYVDGVMKSFSQKKGKVFIKGKPCEILGDIAMSQMMVDVTGLNCRREDDVIIFDRKYQDIYQYIDITGQSINELISHIRYSIPRIYK